jgi:hypothetical protein
MTQAELSTGDRRATPGSSICHRGGCLHGQLEHTWGRFACRRAGCACLAFRPRDSLRGEIYVERRQVSEAIVLFAILVVIGIALAGTSTAVSEVSVSVQYETFAGYHYTYYYIVSAANVVAVPVGIAAFIGAGTVGSDSDARSDDDLTDEEFSKRYALKPEEENRQLRLIVRFKKLRLDGESEAEAVAALAQDPGLVASPAPPIPPTPPGDFRGAGGDGGIGGTVPGVPQPVHEVHRVLFEAGLLEEWPIGWSLAESVELARRMTFDEVVARVERVADLPRDQIVIGMLLAAQAHLAPLLRAIGPAIHGIPVGPLYSAGKTRWARTLTILADGHWTDCATVAYLRNVRQLAPRVLGIDEGDEAERENPGIKAYLLIAHNWDATYGRSSDPDEKGQRSLEDIKHGGPVFLTFRNKPWPAVASRSILFPIERSGKSSVSDDGTGMALGALLLAPSLWLKMRAVKGSSGWDAQRALVRVHSPEFLQKLDQATAGLPILRQRDKARTLLFIAERLGIDLTKQIEATIREEEVESENATVVEAIERDAEFASARLNPEAEVATELLRLRVQKDLRDHREFVDLNRRRFASVLEEMGFSKKKGPTWNEGKGKGRPTVILPGLWARSTSPNPPNPPGTSGHPGGDGGIGGSPREAALAVRTVFERAAPEPRRWSDLRPGIEEQTGLSAGELDRAVGSLLLEGRLEPAGEGVFRWRS